MCFGVNNRYIGYKNLVADGDFEMNDNFKKIWKFEEALQSSILEHFCLPSECNVQENGITVA